MTLSLVVLLGMAALAIDLGHAYVNKTRLQSAVDATALSAAISLSRINDTIVARNDGIQTFTAFADEPGNGELQALDTDAIVFEFSDKLIPFIPNGANPRFVRVIVSNFELPSWLTPVLGIDDKAVSATAVSGPIPLQNVCDIAPVMVCNGVDEGTGELIDDTECSDGSCYGYATDELIVLKTGAGSGQGGDWEVGGGNYRLIRLNDSQGGDDIRHAMAGRYESCLEDADTIPTEPGNTVGPVAQGLNTRFGIYQGGMSRHSDVYKPDLVSDIHGSPVAQNYNPVFPDYLNAYNLSMFDHPDGEPERRVLAVPFADCRTSINGQGELPLTGLGCFFLTRPAEQGGDQEIYGEVIKTCAAKGRPDPNNVSGSGPFKIILYKNPDGRDA